MAELELNQLNGTYSPAYFEIYINTDTEIDLNRLTLDKQATFFHEWIHFIQDFTTGVGCHNAYATIEKLKYVGVLLKDRKDPFQIPLTIGKDYNVLANNWVSTKAWGTNPGSKDYKTITDSKNKNIPIPDGLVSDSTLKEIPICDVTTDNGETFAFGTKAIMESMAFECQALLFPSTAPGHLAFPYHTARKVADNIVPGFTDDPLRLVALCDMSLMASAPGPQFSSYLKEIASGRISFPNRPEEVYDFFYSRSLLKGYQTINELTEKSYLGVYRDPVAFASLRKWISTVYQGALKLRIDSPYFILDLLRGGTLQTNSTFRQLLSIFGSPMLRNNRDHYSKIPYSLSSPDNCDVEYIKPLSTLVDLLTYGDTGYHPRCPRTCRLIKWCIDSDNERIRKGVSDSEMIKVDTNCFLNPSLRIDPTKYSGLCPFALLYYASGLPPFK